MSRSDPLPDVGCQLEVLPDRKVEKELGHVSPFPLTTFGPENQGRKTLIMRLPTLDL